MRGSLTCAGSEKMDSSLQGGKMLQLEKKLLDIDAAVLPAVGVFWMVPILPWSPPGPL